MENPYFWILLLCIVFLTIVVYTYRDKCTVFETIETEDGIIQIVDEACQEGLPHTHNSETMRMTREVYEGLRKDDILLHERVHLDQKRNPDKWNTFYKTQWDYEFFNYPPPGMAPAMVQKFRANPDTKHNPWAVWQKRYVFFPTFTETGKLKDAIVRVWDLTTNQETDIPEQWKTFFCGEQCPYQYEHPHEMSAEYITKQCTSKAAQTLYRWKNM